MTRQVVNTQEVCHLWAHQGQNFARNSNYSVYFEGPVIFSYGNHFPMGKIHVDKQGNRLVLLNSRTYSPTTSGHQRYVWSALLPSDDTIDVPNVRPVSRHEHSQNLQYLKDEMEECAGRAKRSRKHAGMHTDRVRTLADQYNRYSKWFKMRRKPINVNDMEWFEKLTEKAEQQRLTELRERQERDARHREIAEASVAKWLAGETYSISYAYLIPTQLRLMPGNPDTVQTSRGASFPTEQAIEVYRRLHSFKAQGVEYRAGEWFAKSRLRVGPYQIDSMDKDGTVKAGCHTLTWEVIDKFGKYLLTMGQPA